MPIQYQTDFAARQMFQLAYQFQLRSNYKEACFYYQRSLDILPTAEAHVHLGWTYSCMERYEDAIAECKLAIELDPDYGNAYNDIACYLIELDEAEEAISWLERATLTQGLESPSIALVNLARLYEQQGLWPLAIREYRAALRYNPDYLPAKDSLAELEARAN